MRKKYTAKAAAFALVCLMGLPLVQYAGSGPVQASTIVMSDGNLFDPSYYARQNGKSTGINNMDANVLYNHYLTVGRYQGKLPYDPGDSALEETGSLGCLQDDAAVTAAILAQKVNLPEGTSCTNEGYHYSNIPVWPWTGSGCVAFAQQMSDLVYGKDALVSILYSLTEDDLRPGDVLKYYRSNGIAHCVVVLKVEGNTITVCEGNRNGRISYGRTMTRKSLTGRVIYVARREAAE